MLFAPFLFIYLLICLAFLGGLFLLIQIEVIRAAFIVLGLSPTAALFVLLLSLIGNTPSKVPMNHRTESSGLLTVLIAGKEY